MDKLLQQPMTLLTAITVITLALIAITPKLMSELLEWAKWRSSQKDNAKAAGGVQTSQTLAQNTKRRPIHTGRFWLFTFDVITGWACLMVLISLSAEPAPATVGTVAFCATLVVFALSSFLRRW